MILFKDPAHAWGELVKHSKLPHGLYRPAGRGGSRGLHGLRSARSSTGAAASSSTTSCPAASAKRSDKVWISRLTTLVLFVFAAVVTYFFVDNMVSWFMFINSAMVIFLLPLAWFRFFWWRFNVWGELAAVILGLPLSILVWFVLDFQSKPLWQGLGMLFGLSFVVLITVTLLTPPESTETLKRFYTPLPAAGLLGADPARSPARPRHRAQPEADVD